MVLDKREFNMLRYSHRARRKRAAYYSNVQMFVS